MQYSDWDRNRKVIYAYAIWEHLMNTWAHIWAYTSDRYMISLKRIFSETVLVISTRLFDFLSISDITYSIFTFGYLATSIENCLLSTGHWFFKSNSVEVISNDMRKIYWYQTTTNRQGITDGIFSSHVSAHQVPVTYDFTIIIVEWGDDTSANIFLLIGATAWVRRSCVWIPSSAHKCVNKDPNIYITVSEYVRAPNRARPAHYNDVIMGSMACQITSLPIVYSAVYMVNSSAD